MQRPPNTTTSYAPESNASTILSQAVGANVSSASRKHTKSPEAASMPALRALDKPPLSLSTMTMRPSSSARAAMSSREPSGEPSFTHMISKSSNVCASSESRQAPMYASTL